VTRGKSKEDNAGFRRQTRAESEFAKVIVERQKNAFLAQHEARLDRSREILF